MSNGFPKWSGNHEKLHGPASITLVYEKETGSVSFTMDNTYKQRISGRLLLEVAAFMVKAYCADNNIPIENIKLVKEEEDEN